MAGCRRWISSMNRTSRGSRLVRMAARSPARWITGPGGGAEADAEFAGDDLGQGGLAEARRAEQQHVVERLAAGARGLDEDGEVIAGGLLTDEFIEALGAKGGFAEIVLGAVGCEGAVGHAGGVCSGGVE